MSESAYHTVVVGTDGSESSLRAVARALLDVVRRENAGRLVVHTG